MLRVAWPHLVGHSGLGLDWRSIVKSECHAETVTRDMVDSFGNGKRGHRSSEKRFSRILATLNGLSLSIPLADADLYLRGIPSPYKYYPIEIYLVT